MRALLVAVLLSLVGLAVAANAAGSSPSEKKVALIIGNSVYRHAVTLPNPRNDAALMAATLKDSGFEVIEGIDLSKAAMTDIVDRFTEKAYDANVALIFYAGHGVQVDGQNYLIPVDAELTSPAHLRTRAIRVDDMMTSLPPDPAVSVVILDACRDNPLARTLAASLPKSRSSALGVGLAPVEASSQSNGSGGVIIAYATDPGSVALDGKGENSPYTSALAKNIAIPGLEIQSALTRVRAEVTEKTLGRQRPWHNASLGRELFLGGAAPRSAVAAPPLIVGQTAEEQAAGSDWEFEQRLWDEASKRNTVAHYEIYLKQFPNGRFAGVAALNLDQLKAGEIKIAAVSSEDVSKPSSADPSSQVRTALSVPDDVKQLPGSVETEEAIKLDRAGRADVQARLQALGKQPGGTDGSFGPRTRAAIGEWQQDGGIVQTGYLTAQQHLLLSTQTEPLMAAIEADQKRAAAAASRKSKTASTKAPTIKKAQTVQKRAPGKVVSRKKNNRQLIGRAGSGGNGSGNDAAAFVGGVAAGVLVCRAAGSC